MNNTYADNLENVVSYAPQNYPESAKAQARKNIGIDTLGGGNGTIDFDFTQDRVAVPLTSGQTLMTYVLPYDALVQISSRNNLALILNLKFNGTLRAVVTAFSTNSGTADNKAICLKKGTEITISSSTAFNTSHQNVWLFKLK